MRNVAIENCTFQSINLLGCQTVLDFNNTSASIKNCCFNLTSICNDTKESHTMIGASNSNLSIEDSLFITQNGKLLDIEQKSEVNITNTIFRDSKVTDVGDHPALIQVFKSKIKLESCTIRDNKGGLIVRARQCAQVSIDDSRFLNNSAWECTLCASQSNISILNTNISESSGNFSIIYLVKTSTNITGVNFTYNNGSFLVRSSEVTFNGANLFEYCRQNFSRAEKYWAQGTLTVIQSTVTFLGNTSFLENHSKNSGGGMYISESIMKMYGNLTIAKNQAEKNGGGALFYSSTVFCSGEWIFANNTAAFAGGGISIVDTTITLGYNDLWTHCNSFGILNITGNVADVGAGINLEANSKIYGIESSHFHYNIIFASNNASYKGGAIHVNDSTYSSVCASKFFADYDVQTECFLQILHDDEDTGDQTSTISFTNNSANNGLGSILYGGLLDRCTVNPLATEYNKTFHSTEHSDPIHAVDYFRRVTGLNSTSDEIKGIASDSLRICICEGNKTDCEHNNKTVIRVKRGEEFNITVSAVDQVNKSTSENTSISSYLEPECNPSTLGKGQQLQFIQGECSNLTFNVFSPKKTGNTITLVVYVDESPCIDAGLSNRSVRIIFDNYKCPNGFQEDMGESNKCECVCHDRIKDYVMCNPEKQTFLKKTNAWINYINESGYLVYLYCPYDYCKPPSKSDSINLNLPNGADAQCAYNRSGLLCGRCRQGFQLSTATPRCLQCSKSSIGMYVAGYILGGIGGIVMVLLFLMLNVTVVQGTLNGLIFYANIILMCRSSFFPSLHPNFSTVFIYFLNTRLGFDRCYPDSVDEAQKIWHNLFFPVYAFSLVVALILLSKYSSRCAQIIGKRNPVATLATIILFMYTSLLQSVIDILAFAILKYPDGSYKVVWRPDGSVDYFRGKHIPLFLVAVAILTIGLAYTCVLFAWQWLIRAPNKLVFRWIRNTKLGSFMDAYHAPYKPKYRYWTGLLLFVRIMLNLAVMANRSSNPRTNLFAIILFVVFLFLLKAYLGDRIYKQRLLDYFETTCYFNLLLFSLVSFNSVGNMQTQMVAIHVSVGITFVMTMCALLYHIHYTLFCGIKRYKEVNENTLWWMRGRKVHSDTSHVVNSGERTKVHFKHTNTEVSLSSLVACSTEEDTCQKQGTCTLNLSTRNTVRTKSQISEQYTTDLREPLLEQP